MAKRYSIAEARSNLPTIIDHVQAGAEIELTRRGKSVAVVISPSRLDRLRPDRLGFSNAYKVFLQKHSLEEIGLDSDFFASARAVTAST